MKIYYSIILSVGLFLVGYGQKMSSTDCELYTTALDKVVAPKDMPIMVSFEYEMSESLKTTLFEADFFEPEERQVIETSLSDFEVKPCRRVRQKLVEMKVINNSGDYEEYTRINYAAPIIIKEEKAYLFSDRVSIKKGRGIAGGAALVEIYEKLKKTWVLKEKKVLEWY